MTFRAISYQFFYVTSRFESDFRLAYRQMLNHKHFA